MFNQSGQLPDTNRDDQSFVTLNFWQEHWKLLVLSGVLIIGVGLGLWFWLKVQPRQTAPVVSVPVATSTSVVASNTGSLPSNFISNQETLASSTLPAAIELLSFAKFYQAPAAAPVFSPSNYQLPLNIKIDTLNYYDVSRKINLDNSLDSLNNNGFAILNDPNGIAPDFYSEYNYLSGRNLPLLVTSDFLLYYHQNVLKQVYQSIEAEVFYNQLWSILQDLYTVSRTRYEARLAAIGNTSDQVLEGERLSTAYFATALALLSPTTGQIDDNNPTKFSTADSQAYYFSVPSYLSDNVNAELKLIHEASQTTKSPVLLYNRDYSAFVIPDEYRASTKLTNFYLATVWLNSLFPLNYKNDKCPTCLLDQYDGRINLIAASFIARDFSADQRLENHWALIYKLISYFKGLRDGLDYLHYNQSLQKLFGAGYDPEKIFAENNPAASKNVDQLRADLLAFNFKKELGAIDKNKAPEQLGFKFLADYYWPNNYIFTRLSYPEVGSYQGVKPTSANVTACTLTGKAEQRCNGFSLDLPALVSNQMPSSTVWQENTNYQNYLSKLATLRLEIQTGQPWQSNNFWGSVDIFKNIINTGAGQSQSYASTSLWQQRLFTEAAASWVNLQSPADVWKVSVATSSSHGLISNSVLFSDNNYYVEPNYSLVQKLLADNRMIYNMLQALSVNTMLNSAASSLQTENNQLSSLLAIIVKELNDQSLTADDQSLIDSFVSQYQLVNPGQAQPNVVIAAGTGRLQESLGTQLLALVYQLGGNKYLAVGPIFSYSESRLNGN
jgi:hypothetical protein